MREKKWIFFAPCSNPIAQSHFKDTILKGVKIGEILEFLNERDKKILSDKDPLRISGNTSG